MAYAVRPRNVRKSARLCFSLVSMIPTQKPWARDLIVQICLEV